MVLKRVDTMLRKWDEDYKKRSLKGFASFIKVLEGGFSTMIASL